MQLQSSLSLIRSRTWTPIRSRLDIIFAAFLCPQYGVVNHISAGFLNLSEVDVLVSYELYLDSTHSVDLFFH